jgi:hypothetical protein
MQDRLTIKCFYLHITRCRTGLQQRGEENLALAEEAIGFSGGNEVRGKVSHKGFDFFSCFFSMFCERKGTKLLGQIRILGSSELRPPAPPGRQLPAT